MRHIYTAIVTVLLLTPAKAAAMPWDWIKELSGPGDSTGNPGLLTTVCPFQWFSDANIAVNDEPRWNRIPCVFADRRSVKNKDDDNFPNRVRIESYDFGASWKLAKARLELGVGAGVMIFHSEDLINNSGKMTRTKLTLTPLRAVIAPIRLFFPDAVGAKGRWTRIVKGYFRVNMITGNIGPTDFGVRAGTGPGESSWPGATNEFVPSAGFIVDFGELLF